MSIYCTIGRIQQHNMIHTVGANTIIMETTQKETE